MIISEKCGILRKYLKQDILQFVITLRIVFVKMKTQLENKSKRNNKLSEEFYRVKKNGEIKRLSTSERSGAISGPESSLIQR